MNDLEIIVNYLELNPNEELDLEKISIILSEYHEYKYSINDVVVTLEYYHINLNSLTIDHFKDAHEHFDYRKKNSSIFINYFVFPAICIMLISFFPFYIGLFSSVILALCFCLDNDSSNDVSKKNKTDHNGIFKNRSLFELWSYLAICYTISFNFFKYYESGNFDYHIFLNPFDPLVFIISILLYFGIFRYTTKKITIILPLAIFYSIFLYLIFTNLNFFWISIFLISIVWAIFSFYMYIEDFYLLKYYIRSFLNKHTISKFSVISFIIILCSLPFQKNDSSYHSTYFDLNKNQCSNIDYDFNIIKNSNKNGFIVIDSKVFTIDDILSYLSLRNSSSLPNELDFEVEGVMFNEIIKILYTKEDVQKKIKIINSSSKSVLSFMFIEFYDKFNIFFNVLHLNDYEQPNIDWINLFTNSGHLDKNQKEMKENISYLILFGSIARNSFNIYEQKDYSEKSANETYYERLKSSFYKKERKEYQFKDLLKLSFLINDKEKAVIKSIENFYKDDKNTSKLTLDMIDFYIKLDNRERFFYYKCD